VSVVPFAAAIMRAVDELERGRRAYVAAAARGYFAPAIGAPLAADLDVVASWQPYFEDGGVVLDVAITDATAQK
jgi:hypothetical protein